MRANICLVDDYVGTTDDIADIASFRIVDIGYTIFDNSKQKIVRISKKDPVETEDVFAAPEIIVCTEYPVLFFYDTASKEHRRKFMREFVRSTQIDAIRHKLPANIPTKTPIMVVNDNSKEIVCIRYDNSEYEVHDIYGFANTHAVDMIKTKGYYSFNEKGFIKSSDLQGVPVPTRLFNAEEAFKKAMRGV